MINRVTQKIAIAAAGLGTAAGLIAGLASITLTVDNDVVLAKQSSETLIRATLPQVSDAYWQVDLLAVKSILTGLLEDELISDVTLEDPLATAEQRRDLTVSKSSQGGAERTRAGPMLSLLRWWGGQKDVLEYSLASPRDGKEIGRLIATLNYDPIYKRILDRALFIFAANLLQAMLVTAAIFLMVQYVIVRPLGRLKKAVNTARAGKDSDQGRRELHSFSQTRSDEIAQLASAFSGMVGELDANQKSLEGLVQTRTEELVRARNQALDASEAKSRFLANINHELRTPLNAISGLSALLQDETASPRQRRFIADIRHAASYLGETIDSVLDISKIEANKLELEAVAFNLDDVLDDVICHTRALLGGGDVRLTYSISPDVPKAFIGDPIRIKQILLNLTSNAVKFTRVGCIDISVTASGGADGITEISLAVKDSGIGISSDELERVFDSFTQADPSTARVFGGSGLGLNIAQHLATMMDGTLQAESRPNEGSTFTVCLALPTSPIRAVSEPPQDRVLLVACEAEPFRSLFERSEIKAAWAQSLDDAAALLAQLSPSEPPYTIVAADYGTAVGNKLPALLDHPKLQSAGLVVFYRATDDPSQLAETTACPMELLTMPAARRELLSAFERIERKVLRGASAGQQARPRAQTLSGKIILLAEDNEVNRIVATELLERLGASVQTAEDGKAALEIVESTSPDLILMDLQMPIMDGFQVTDLLRRQLGPLTPPIVAVTANATVEEEQRCMDAGMVRFLSKPIDPEELERTVVEVLGPGSEHEDARRWGDLRQVPLVDRSHGLRCAGESNELYLHSLARFSDQLERFAREAGSPLGWANGQSPRDVLHGLKGGALTIGAMRLAEAIQGTERRAGGVGEWRQSHDLDHIVQTALETRIEIEKTLAQSAGSSTRSSVSFEELTRTLDDKLMAHDLDALKVVDSLEAYREDRNIGNAVEDLIAALEALDFRAAQDALDKARQITRDLYT